MQENQFIKLSNENSEILLVNISNITHMTQVEGVTQIHLVGLEHAITTSQSVGEIMNLLPSSLGYENL